MGMLRVFFPDGTDFSSDVMLYVDDPVMYSALMAKLSKVEGELAGADLEAIAALVAGLTRDAGRVLYVDNGSAVSSGVAFGSGVTSDGGETLVAHGINVHVSNLGVVFGIEAEAGALGAAFGRLAKALHPRSIAIGNEVSTSGPDQAAFGKVHLEVGAPETVPDLPSAGSARVYTDGSDLFLATSAGRKTLSGGSGGGGGAGLVPVVDIGTPNAYLELNAITLGTTVTLAHAGGQLILEVEDRPIVPAGMTGATTLVVRKTTATPIDFQMHGMCTPYGLPISVTGAAGSVHHLQIVWDGARWTFLMAAAQVGIPTGWAV